MSNLVESQCNQPVWNTHSSTVYFPHDEMSICILIYVLYLSIRALIFQLMGQTIMHINPRIV